MPIRSTKVWQRRETGTERQVSLGPIGVNNVLGEQKGKKKLIRTREPERASFKKGFKLEDISKAGYYGMAIPGKVNTEQM